MKYYHVWFQTKKRKRVLFGDIDRSVHALFKYISYAKGIRLVACETMIDHAHLLLALKAQDDLYKAVKLIKGASARMIFMKHPLLKQQIKCNNFWARKYGFKEIPERQLDRVAEYISNQKKDLHILFPTF